MKFLRHFLISPPIIKSDQILLAIIGYLMRIKKEASKNPMSKNGLKKSRLNFMGNLLQFLIITTIYKILLMIGLRNSTIEDHRWVQIR